MTGFEDVYILYFKDVYRYVLSLCRNEAIAEDVTQETFFKALKSIDNFGGKCRLRVWLCQIAKNTYFSMYENQKKNAGFTIEEADGDGGFEQEFINRETAFEIHKRLHELEEPYKEVFSLHMFGELPFSRIGELFGKTESWARVTYHRAKLKLREDLT